MHRQDSTSKATYLATPDEASCSTTELAPIYYASPTSNVRTAGQPPSLEYDFVRRHRSLCINLVVIISVNTAAPTLAFYLSRHLSDDSPATTYTWVTLALGTLELFQWPYRCWQLCRDGFARSAYPHSGPMKGSFFGKLGAFVGHLDFFAWCLLCGIVEGAIVLTIASSINGSQGSLPLLVMSVPIITASIGILLIGTVVMSAYQVRTPRWAYISSLPPGTPMRPAMAFLIEDLVSVDGAGGKTFRDRLGIRYDASPLFRQMCRDTTLIFALWGCALPIWDAILLANITDHDVLWGASIAVALVWTAICTVTAWRWMRRCIEREKEWWAGSRPAA